MKYVQQPTCSVFEDLLVETANTTDKDFTSSVDISSHYVNECNLPITVVERNGHSFTLPPGRSSRQGQRFIVKKIINSSREVKNDSLGLLSSALETDDLELVKLREALVEPQARNIQGSNKSSVIYTLDLEDIKTRGGNLYLPALDIVVSIIAEPSMVAFHPYSTKAERGKLIESNDNVNSIDSFGYNIKIVDKDGSFGERYINIDKLVYRVPVSEDPNLKNGIYITNSGEVKGNFKHRVPVCNFVKFEDADGKFGMYKTYEEALNFGDAEASHKAEIEQMKIDAKKLEEKLRKEKIERDGEHARKMFDLEREKEELERVSRERNEEIAQRANRLKQERDEMEHRRRMDELNRKDYYEERSSRRKDNSETWKALPTIVAGATAVISLVVAFRKQSQ